MSLLLTAYPCERQHMRNKSRSETDFVLQMLNRTLYTDLTGSKEINGSKIEAMNF